MIQTNFNLPIISYLFFGASLLLLLYIILAYCGSLRRILRQMSKSDDNVTMDPSSLPKASIIIFTRDEPEALERNLPAILEQDYPAGFEVIIVNDGASAETSMAVGKLKISHPNIYLTYTPDGARNLSRKKLGLTLGVKAAKGDVVVVSDANARVASDKWLLSIMNNFANPDIDVVFGWGVPSTPSTHIAGRLTRAFDCAADNATWLNSAICGSPYRACGYNLAYRRNLFFENKGFSKSLNLREGDDDIFVSEISTPQNVGIELSPESRVTIEDMPYMKRTWQNRVSHHFTGSTLPKAQRRVMAFGEWSMWLVVACSLGGAYFAGIFNVIGWSLAFAIILSMFIVTGMQWRKFMRSFQITSLGIALPFQAMTRPFRNIFVAFSSKFSDHAHYTWQ